MVILGGKEDLSLVFKSSISSTVKYPVIITRKLAAGILASTIK